MFKIKSIVLQDVKKLKLTFINGRRFVKKFEDFQKWTSDQRILSTIMKFIDRDKPFNFYQNDFVLRS